MGEENNNLLESFLCAFEERVKDGDKRKSDEVIAIEDQSISRNAILNGKIENISTEADMICQSNSGNQSDGVDGLENGINCTQNRVIKEDSPHQVGSRNRTPLSRKKNPPLKPKRNVMVGSSSFMSEPDFGEPLNIQAIMDSVRANVEDNEKRKLSDVNYNHDSLDSIESKTDFEYIGNTNTEYLGQIHHSSIVASTNENQSNVGGNASHLFCDKIESSLMDLDYFKEYVDKHSDLSSSHQCTDDDEQHQSMINDDDVVMCAYPEQQKRRSLMLLQHHSVGERCSEDELDIQPLDKSAMLRSKAFSKSMQSELDTMGTKYPSKHPLSRSASSASRDKEYKKPLFGLDEKKVRKELGHLFDTVSNNAYAKIRGFKKGKSKPSRTLCDEEEKR